MSEPASRRRRVAGTGEVAVPPRRRIRWVVPIAVTFILVNILAIGAYANSRFG